MDGVLRLQTAGRDLYASTEDAAQQLDGGGFRTAWEGPFATAYINSFLVASLVTIITLLTCAMAAYAFARIRFPGSNVLLGSSWPR